MPLSNPFRRAADRPSLRERAAALRASFRPAAPVAAPAPTTSPAPGSAEAMAAFHEACRQHSIRTAPLHNWPELMRAGQDVWSTQSLGQALEAGEIGADEYARLHPLASERELRFAEITHELNIGALFALAYASEYPVPPVPEGKADGELLRLGHLFEAAREREMRANETLNAAQREARQHMPERPAALLFRASDHPLHLRKYYVHPDGLEGIEVTSEDIAWMTRKPCARTVSRPVLPEDNLPADARAVVSSEPWPEAQIRADEIVAAWSAWLAERDATRDRYVLHEIVREADEAGDATMALAERLAAIPARTADGFRLKLRALTHYRSDVLDAELEDESDPDQILSYSIWRDVQGEMPAAFNTEVAPGAASIIHFGPDAHIAELAAEFWEAYAANIKADREHMAERMSEAEWLPHYQRANALMKKLEAAEPKTLLGMALKCLGPIGAAGYNAPADPDEAQADAWDRAGTQLADAVLAGSLSPLPTAVGGLGPVDLIAAAGLSLKGISLRDVAALHDVTVTLTNVVRAMQMQPRSWCGPHLSDVGKFTDWLGDQLDAQIDATVKELRARKPADWIERDIRLEAIAQATISNGDPAEIASFARDLRDYAGRHDSDTPADPVLALIAESLRVEEEAADLDANWRSIPLAERAGREDAMSDRQAKAREAALKTLPTTHEGLKAFADYVGYQASLTYGSDWRAKISQEMGGDLLVALCAAVETAADA